MPDVRLGPTSSGYPGPEYPSKGWVRRLPLEAFPPYAPELNPDEGDWTLAKGKRATGRPDSRETLRVDLLAPLSASANPSPPAGMPLPIGPAPYCPNHCMLYTTVNRGV